MAKTEVVKGVTAKRDMWLPYFHSNYPCQKFYEDGHVGRVVKDEYLEVGCNFGWLRTPDLYIPVKVTVSTKRPRGFKRADGRDKFSGPVYYVDVWKPPLKEEALKTLPALIASGELGVCFTKAGAKDEEEYWRMGLEPRESSRHTLWMTVKRDKSRELMGKDDE
ncbi:MAG: hypothetical protein ACYTG7_23115 [Planctomycetota bacterium]|jgi:hypothetical protein